MKRILSALCLMFMVLSISIQAQVPKKKPVTPGMGISQDTTITLNMTAKMDTVAVKMIVENPDGFLEVVKGYTVRFFWVSKETGQPISQNPSKVSYFTDKWINLLPDKVIEPLTRQINPPNK